MELDDFRSRWQAQPVAAPTEPLPTEQALRAMLTSHTSTNPLVRLKRNASRELQWIFAGMGLLVFDVLIFFRHAARMQLFAAGVLAIICLVGLIVYQRLKLIRQMEQQQGNLYHVLKSRIDRFRQLMRLHDYVGAVALALLSGAVIGVRWANLWAYLAPGQPNWGWRMGVAGIGMALLLALIYGAYAVGQKEHQRRYGRYLDQLEAALRELQD